MHMKMLTKDVWMEILFSLFVFSVWLLWAFILPLNEGPDENMRLQIVEFILEYGKLPTGYQKEIMDYTWGFTYGFRPILPQMLEALFVHVFSSFTQDAFVLLYAGRLANVFCGVVFLGYVRALGGLLFDKRSSQRLFVLLNVCLPGASFLFTYLNCDSMALMASAMILYYLSKGMRDSFSLGTCIWLAVSFSVCILSYYNAYGFLLTGTVIFSGYYLEKSTRGERPWKEFIGKGALIAGLVLILAGWWFVRNYFLYDGDILGLRTQEECAQRYALDLFKPSGRRNCVNQGISLGDMLFRSDWTVLVFKSFVGILAPLKEAHRSWIFAGYGILFLTGGIGILGECFWKGKKRWAEHRKWRGRKIDISQTAFHLGLAAAIVLPNALNVWYSYSNDYQPQGRYSMPMLVPFMYYVVRGIGYLGTEVEEKWRSIGKKVQKTAGELACLWIVAVLAFCTVGIMWPAYGNVTDRTEVRVYTLEELFGERDVGYGQKARLRAASSRYPAGAGYTEA